MEPLASNKRRKVCVPLPICRFAVHLGTTGQVDIHRFLDIEAEVDEEEEDKEDKEEDMFDNFSEFIPSV